MKKEGKDMHTEITENITNRSEVLSYKQVKDYNEPTLNGEPVITARTGHSTYNNGSILVNSKHPLEQCLNRGIIEDEHYDIGKRISNYRHCFNSKRAGRVYNATGEGDSTVDAATVYARLMRKMCSNPTDRENWKRIEIICFTEPNIDGEYLHEGDYRFLFAIAHKIQNAFEVADKLIYEIRNELKAKLEAEEAARQK